MYLIVYDELAPPRRRAFTLAHEIGHVILRHRDDSAERERQADRFAAELLAPRVLLAELALRLNRRPREGEICRLFSLSFSAAQHRSRELTQACGFSQAERALLTAYASLLPDPREPALEF